MNTDPSTPSQDGTLFTVTRTSPDEEGINITITPKEPEDLKDKMTEKASDAFLAADGTFSAFMEPLPP